MDRRFRLARIWSNQELRKIGPLCKGSVVNVSGWQDEDKEGGRYQDYFPRAEAYAITNYGGYRGEAGDSQQISLDLSQPLPDELHGQFDVVFNHTTLEHIYEVRLGFASLCELSRDLVIVVAPFSQVSHGVEDFGDYWRFTLQGLARMFAENGLEVVYQAQSPHRNSAIYLFMVGSRHPQAWQERMPDYDARDLCGDCLGESWPQRIKRTIKRIIGK